MEKKAWLEGFGSCEILNIPVANTETTKAVVFKQVHINPVVFTSADYVAGVFVTNASKLGCNITFTDPTADKNITLLVIG